MSHVDERTRKWNACKSWCKAAWHKFSVYVVPVLPIAFSGFFSVLLILNPPPDESRTILDWLVKHAIHGLGISLFMTLLTIIVLINQLKESLKKQINKSLNNTEAEIRKLYSEIHCIHPLSQKNSGHDDVKNTESKGYDEVPDKLIKFLEKENKRVYKVYIVCLGTGMLGQFIGNMIDKNFDYNVPIEAVVCDPDKSRLILRKDGKSEIKRLIQKASTEEQVVLHPTLAMPTIRACLVYEKNSNGEEGEPVWCSLQMYMHEPFKKNENGERMKDKNGKYIKEDGVLSKKSIIILRDDCSQTTRHLADMIRNEFKRLENLKNVDIASATH